MTGQQGQAVVAVLVIMMVVFLVAAGVAFGASALLAQQGRAGAVTEDFSASSAVAGAVARAGAMRCDERESPFGATGASAARTQARPASVARFTLRLPAGVSSVADCTQLHGAAAQALGNKGGPLGYLPLAWPATEDCASAPLPAELYEVEQDVWVFFNLRWRTELEVYVRRAGSCQHLVPPDALCVSSLPVPSRSTAGSVVQMALSCHLPKADRPLAVYVHSPGLLPKAVMYARQDGRGGTMYLLAAGTGRPAEVEEAVMFVPGGSSGARLLHQGTVP